MDEDDVELKEDERKQIYVWLCFDNKKKIFYALFLISKEY